ncbi:hypothetical protein C4D60_Mb11t16820 [Musa balbisiana]|uniref:Uncharacterized protein n=1 Tax=Musa balbisiana TaxID=52838 RepID=A0A4V6T4A5_MUSBA|nr:hypothetical protein C4D60_Mb11t16820 [Musa balbisiana]
MGDSTAMTIEFLRARLLSERTVSKAAKERADQLAKRVMELEERLRVMTIQRRKAEQAAVDAISILETHGINDLFEEIDSSSDKDESPCGEEGCEEASKEDEVCTASKVERMVVEDAQSSSELEVSFSQARSLSWRSRSSSPDSARKLKGKHFRQRQRRMSLMSPVESSPKYNLGKSCRKIKRKEMGSTTEHKGDDFVIIGNSLPGLSVIVSGSQSSFATVQKQEVDAIGSEKDKEMERILEQQAQLIGQYEAEEKAQREWEKKYNENKCSNPDYSESEKQCHVAVVNSESQKDSLAVPEKIPYEDEEPKSDVLSGTKEPGCLSDDIVLKLSDSANQGTIDGGQDANVVQFSNAFVSSDLPRTGSGSNSQACVEGLTDQVAHHVAVTDSEACLVEVAFPAKVSTVASSFEKQNQGLIYNKSDSGSSNNINMQAHSQMNSPLNGSPSTANSERETPKWESAGTQDPSYERPPQSAGSSSLGGVLDALQRAKISLKQELYKSPLPGKGTMALPAARNYHTKTTLSGETLKVPIGSAGLFRLPTDTFPLAQNLQRKLYGSGLSLTTGYPHLGYAFTTADGHPSTIPEAGSKNSMGKLDFGHYHPGMDLPTSFRYSLPYSGSTADRIPVQNEADISLGKQHFNTYSYEVGIPAFSRYSLPANEATDGTPFPNRSGGSVHQQYFDSYHPGVEEPAARRFSLPYSDLTRDRTILRDGVSEPHTDIRNQVPPRDRYSLYGGNGTRSSMQIL